MNAGRALAFAIPFSLASSLAFAQDSPPADGKPAAPPGAAAAPAKGLVVFVDPVTGKIRQPDPAEIGALTAPKPGAEAARPAPEAPLQMKFGPGGAVGVALDSRFESFMVVTKKPDGTLSMSCVTDGRKAEEAVLPGAKPSKEGKEAPRVP